MNKSKKLFLADNWAVSFFVLAVLIFFYPFILLGKIPLPADTILGMYHPFRDVVWDGLTSGVPFKNFLITDPVRQQYVWRIFGIEHLKKWQLPLWNPYSFSGAPLLANFQSAIFYPLNVLFFLLPINKAWGILVLLQPMLAGVFLYLYLRFVKINSLASLIGGFAFSFSGFFIAWLEWNTIVHTILWLPLILLSIEKLIKIKNLLFWTFIFIFSLISSFFAGHLQVFSYGFIFSFVYLILKILFLKKNKFKVFLLFFICYFLFVVITSIQWIPTLQFISQSARDVDQGSWQKEGWFIPWQQLFQFIAPDFFGNPATLNYWGIWNYGEFIGYIGILPLFFVLYALFFRRDKKTLFFTITVFIGLVFALPTPMAKLIYQLNFSLLSTSQPTRLLSLITFSLSILSALGMDFFFKERNTKRTYFILLGFIGVLLFSWLFILFPVLFTNQLRSEWILTARRNLILPSLLIFVMGALLIAISRIRKNFELINLLGYFLIIFLMFDLFRFGWKFTPFSKEEWIFPSTRLLTLLKNESREFRIMSLDRRLMPPNFSLSYRLQDVSGYDPLYLKNYGQFISSWENNKESYEPSSFNRILTPQNYESFITDLMGVKYLLSLTPLASTKLNFIAKEGETYLYENKLVYPRAFFVERVEVVDNSDQQLKKLFDLKGDLRTTAVISDKLDIEERKLEPSESVTLTYYDGSLIKINTVSLSKRLLVLTDIYYPTWRVWIDGNPGLIIRTNYIFRGVVIPEGSHTVEFKPMIL